MGGLPGEKKCFQCFHKGSECVWKPSSPEKLRLVGSDNGGDLASEKKAKNTNQTDATTSIRFKCPFLWRNPDRWRKVHACSSGGWDQIHRLRYALPNSMLESNHNSVPDNTSSEFTVFLRTARGASRNFKKRRR
jgi:hypothetical protein